MPEDIQEDPSQKVFNHIGWDVSYKQAILIAHGPKEHFSEKVKEYRLEILKAFSNREKVDSQTNIDPPNIVEELYSHYRNSSLNDDYVLRPVSGPNIVFANNIHEMPLLLRITQKVLSENGVSIDRAVTENAIAHEMRHYARLAGSVRPTEVNSKGQTKDDDRIKMGVSFFYVPPKPRLPGQFGPREKPSIFVSPFVSADGRISNLEYIELLLAPLNGKDGLSSSDREKLHAIQKALVEKGTLESTDDITTSETRDKLYKAAEHDKQVS